MLHYTYTSTGQKISQQLEDDGRMGTRREYAGSFVYVNNTLGWINTIYGRIVAVPKGGLRKELHLRDHLGNTRMVLEEVDGNYEVVQEAAYYPFGMAIPSQSFALPKENNTYQNRYLYNGKEYQDDFGLNWYDYGARFYDPQIARFHSIDPLAESFPHQSPFVYAANNPIRFIDYMGMSAEEPDKEEDEDNFDWAAAWKEALKSKHHAISINFNRNEDYGDNYEYPESIDAVLNWGSVGFTALGSGFSALGNYHSLHLYETGFRGGTNGNYLLTGRNLNLFGNKPLTLVSKPVSGFMKFGHGFSFLGTTLGYASLGYNTLLYSNGQIGFQRYSYQLGTTLLTSGAAYFLGTPAGVVVGSSAIAGDMWYNGLMKYMRELGDNLGSWNYHIKRGWNPQSINF